MKTLALFALVLFTLPAYASLDVYPRFMNFSDTDVGRRSITQSVTVSNRGQDDINDVNVYPSCGLSFDVSPGSCFGPLRANQSCSFNVAFSPNREGYESCSINISSSNGSTSVSASGRGVKRNDSVLFAKKPRLMPKQK